MSAPAREGAGVLYVATGERVRAEALRSLRSLRQHSPDIPVALFVDAEAVGSALWREADRPEVIAEPWFAYRDKIRPLLDRPFARTLFLDADTLVRRPLEPLFALLDVVDVAAAPELWRAGVDVPVPEVFVEPNTGVMLLGPAPAVDDLIGDWEAKYEVMIADRDAVVERTMEHPLYQLPGVPPPVLHDQPPFRWALWEAMQAGTIRFTALAEETNVRVSLPMALGVGTMPWVMHSHDPDIAAVAETLEATQHARVRLPGLSGGISGRLSTELIIGGTWGRTSTRVLGALDDLRHGVRRVLRRRRPD